MKKFFLLSLICFIFTGCGAVQEISAEETMKVKKVNELQIKIQIGGKILDAKLENNSSTQAFLKNLPLEITMDELNGNEKYFRLNQNLPSNDKKIGKIERGDLMLWSSNTIVLFYEDFSTNYSYTRLGRIKNPENLAEIVGEGNISVKFFK
jgi:hypothetical protein